MNVLPLFEAEARQLRRALSVKEFCGRYNCGRTFAYEQMDSGELKFFYLGRHRRILVEEAELWLSRLQQKAEN